eukprot:2865495-Karenia_brevis.AAC.1
MDLQRATAGFEMNPVLWPVFDGRWLSQSLMHVLWAWKPKGAAAWRYEVVARRLDNVFGKEKATTDRGCHE